MEGGNETTNGSGVTQFAEGEPNNLNPTFCSPVGGAKPHGQKDKVLPPNKPVSALPASNQEPTLSVRNSVRFAHFITAFHPLATPKILVVHERNHFTNLASSMNHAQSYCRSIKRMRNSAGLLPSAYQQVEYLQSSGTQYIVTSVPIASYVETHCTGILSGTNTDLVSLVGGRNHNSGYGRYIVFSPQYSKLRLAYGEVNVNLNYASGDVLYEIIFNDSTHKVYIDGVQAAAFGSVSLDVAGQQNITLFGLSGYDGSHVDFLAIGKLYSVSFYNNTNGKQLGDYIPCYRKSDNKPGMYDLITTTFFTNAGTGEFTVGNII